MDRHLEIVSVREELDVVFTVVKEGVGVVGDLLQSGAAAFHELHTGEDVREDGIAAFGRDHVVHFFVVIGAFRDQLIQQLLVPLKLFHVVEDDTVFFAIHIKLAARHGLRFPIAFLPPRNGRRGNAEFLCQSLLAERQPHSRISNFFTNSHRFTFYNLFLS